MACAKRRLCGVEGPLLSKLLQHGCRRPFSTNRVSSAELHDYNIQITKMLSLDDYLREAEVAHGHLCAGQVLGVRLAVLGLAHLGIEDPRGKDRKRLVTFVEIDRCATDAIGVVTGCRLGKRALKFRDWGKMAATFVDVHAGKNIRLS